MSDTLLAEQSIPTPARAFKGFAFILGLVALVTLPGTKASAGDKLPLKMSAVFTKGQIGNVSKDATYSSGDYRCTKGDENNAPDCRTSLEWAEMDEMAGTPDKVAFTMADGTVVKVQSNTKKKLPGYSSAK